MLPPYPIFHFLLLVTHSAVWPGGSIKSSPISPKVAKNVDTKGFTFKVMLFKKPKKFYKYLGHFWKKICCQELSKVARSGRSVV